MSKTSILLCAFSLFFASSSVFAEKRTFDLELPMERQRNYSVAFWDVSGMGDIPIRYSIELFKKEPTTHGGTRANCSAGLVRDDTRVTNLAYGSHVLPVFIECDSFVGLNYYRLRVKRCPKLKQCKLPKSSATRIGRLNELRPKPRVERGLISLGAKAFKTSCGGELHGVNGRCRVFQRFSTPFSNKPSIVAGVTKIDANADATRALRVEFTIDDVQRDGFSYTFATWSNSKINTAEVTWLAIDGG